MPPADVHRRQPREPRFEGRVHRRQAHEVTVDVERAAQSSSIGNDRRAEPDVAGDAVPTRSVRVPRRDLCEDDGHLDEDAALDPVLRSTCSDRSISAINATSLGPRRRTVIVRASWHRARTRPGGAGSVRVGSPRSAGSRRFGAPAGPRPDVTTHACRETAATGSARRMLDASSRTRRRRGDRVHLTLPSPPAPGGHRAARSLPDPNGTTG